MRDYYDARADEYDDWWRSTGLFADRNRPGWAGEVLALEAALAALTPCRTLDVACGTGFLTRHLPGEVIGSDQSERMLAVARARVLGGRFVRADAFALPFSDAAFDRVFSGHFYGHLDPVERAAFLGEARRLAAELVLVDSALRPGVAAEAMQERTLDDGSRWEVLKRFFTADGLLAELRAAGCGNASGSPGAGGGGGAGATCATVFAGAWFVAVRVPLR